MYVEKGSDDGLADIFATPAVPSAPSAPAAPAAPAASSTFDFLDTMTSNPVPEDAPAGIFFVTPGIFSWNSPRGRTRGRGWYVCSIVFDSLDSFYHDENIKINCVFKYQENNEYLVRVIYTNVCNDEIQNIDVNLSVPKVLFLLFSMIWIVYEEPNQAYYGDYYCSWRTSYSVIQV